MTRRTRPTAPPSKIVPAVLAGNTVVLKPSPHTPVATLRLGELAQDIFPRGVVNVVSGGNELGACGVRKVDGFSIHPARKLTTCPDCKRITKESMQASAQAEAGGKVPNGVIAALGSGAAS